MTSTGLNRFCTACLKIKGPSSFEPAPHYKHSLQKGKRKWQKSQAWSVWTKCKSLGKVKPSVIWQFINAEESLSFFKITGGWRRGSNSQTFIQDRRLPPTEITLLGQMSSQTESIFKITLYFLTLSEDTASNQSPDECGESRCHWASTFHQKFHVGKSTLKGTGRNSMIMECLGLERTFKTIQFQAPAMVRDTSHWTRLFRVPKM